VARRSATLALDPIVAGLADLPGPEEADRATTRILDAAAALMADFGLGRWSVEDVAERSGLGRTTVYRRFDGRDALVHAVLAREARRFFDAIALAVAHLDDVADQVVEGLLVGLRMAQASVLPALLRVDAAAVLPLLTTGAGPMLDASRAALVELHRATPGARRSPDTDREVALVADALVRLALSWLLAPSPLVDLDDEEAARAAIGRIVRPLVAAT
jgi:AcrR family transcriptional regulator